MFKRFGLFSTIPEDVALLCEGILLVYARFNAFFVFFALVGLSLYFFHDVVYAGIYDTADYYRFFSTFLGLPATRRDIDAAELKSR